MNKKCYNVFNIIFNIMFCVGALLLISCIYFKIDSIFNLASYILMSNFVLMLILDIYKPKHRGVKK